MQVFRDVFPGIDEALDGLPNCGQLLLNFFDLYSRVNLRAWLPYSGMPLGRKDVSLRVERYGSSYVIFSANENGPRLKFSADNDFRGEFRIAAVHLDLDFGDIAEKFTTWSSNQIAARLDAHEFRLGFSGESSIILLDRCLALPMFVGRSLQEIEFHLTGLKGTGIIIPRSDNYLRATWNRILPVESEHYKLIERVVYWYNQWGAAKQLSTDEHISVDLIRMWARYQTDMRTFEHLLKEE